MKKHPEQKPGEVFWMNAPGGNVDISRWESAREGNTSYLTKNGTKAPEKANMRPIFVKRAELEAAGVRITKDMVKPLPEGA